MLLKKKKKILDPFLFLEKKMENNVSIRFEINDVALAFKYTDNRYVKNVFPRRTRWFHRGERKKQLSVRRRFDLFPERKVLSRRIVYMEQPRLRVSYNRRKHPTKLKVPSEREIHL